GAVVCFVFFFSSRRRHTRSKRDWSSDVCSSDLCWSWLSRASSSPAWASSRSNFLSSWANLLSYSSLGVAGLTRLFSKVRAISSRSEERRVGKERRFRWGEKCCKERKKNTGSTCE